MKIKLGGKIEEAQPIRRRKGKRRRKEEMKR